MDIKALTHLPDSFDTAAPAASVQAQRIVTTKSRCSKGTTQPIEKSLFSSRVSLGMPESILEPRPGKKPRV